MNQINTHHLPIMRCEKFAGSASIHPVNTPSLPIAKYNVYLVIGNSYSEQELWGDYL